MCREIEESGNVGYTTVPAYTGTVLPLPTLFISVSTAIAIR